MLRTPRVGRALIVETLFQTMATVGVLQPMVETWASANVVYFYLK